MKHGNYKRLTRAQKIILSKYDRRYKADNWLCKADTPKVLQLIHRTTGTTIEIPKAAVR